MTASERQQVLERVTEALAAVRDEVTRLEEVTRPVEPDVAVGRISRMDAIGNKAINEQALESARSRLAQLETVLAGAESPDFGLCMGCLAPIPVVRLLAMPESVLCSRCAG